MILGITPIQVVWFKKCATKGSKINLNISEIYISFPVWPQLDSKTDCPNDNMLSERKDDICGNFFRTLPV